MLKVIQVSVSKETHELGQGVRNFFKACRQALADGWQPGSDVTAVVQAAFTDLMPHIQDAEKIKNEPLEDKKAFVKALNDCATDLAFDFLGE